MTNQEQLAKRILIVDDNPEIHKDFQKILSHVGVPAVAEHEAILFELSQSEELCCHHYYRIDSARQGQEAFELVKHMSLPISPKCIVNAV